jgi:hypothetical protein
MASKRKAGSSLSHGQIKAAGLIMAGLSNEQVAQELGIHPCTVAHWKSDQRFLGYLNLLQHDANQMILEHLSSAFVEALNVLEQMVDDPKLSWMQKSMVATRILALIN